MTPRSEQVSETRSPRYLTVRASPKAKRLHLQSGESERTLCAKAIETGWAERPAAQWKRESARCKECARIWKYNIPMCELWEERT